MKVLMLEHYMPGSPYAKELCTELQKHAAVDVFCCTKVKEPLLQDYMVPCLYNGGAGSPLAAAVLYARGLLKTVSAVLFRHYDVVHVQSFKNDAVEIPLYLFLNRCRKLPIVHTVHNILPHEAKEKDKALYGRFYHTCRALIVHNEHTKQRLMDMFGVDEARVHVIPHGSYTHGTAEAEVHEDGRTVFLMFGALRKYKGIDILIEAVSKIPAQIRSKMRFIIAGTQWSKLDSTDYAGLIKEHGLSDVFELILHHIPEEEVPALLARADACVFPYREIYGSGALLMAYTHGRPVLASDVPVFLEETENGMTGLLFPKEDPAALAQALMRFHEMTPAERVAYTGNIRALVEKKYNWQLSGKKTAEVYSSLIPNK